MDDSFDQDVSEMCVSITEENLKVAAAKWILKNREGHRIPNSVMESIVSGAKFLYEAALSQIQQQVVDKMKEASVTPDAIISVSSVFDGETRNTVLERIQGVRNNIPPEFIHQGPLQICCMSLK